MAFGARNENGTWRLCLRKGDTILFINANKHPGVEIQFSSQAKAKACADALNEQFWDTYRKHDRTGANGPYERSWEMLEVIKEHGGLTQLDIEVIKNGK